MRRRAWLGDAGAALAACAGLAGSGGASALPPPAADAPRPAWTTVALLGGGRFGPADAAGNAVIVVFWSTSCPFCRRHNQRLEKLHRAARGSALRVLGVARENDAAAVATYARAQGYSFPITVDAAPLAAVLSARKVVPLTAIVDRQGRLRQVVPGEMAEDDLLELLALGT